MGCRHKTVLFTTVCRRSSSTINISPDFLFWVVSCSAWFKVVSSDPGSIVVLLQVVVITSAEELIFGCPNSSKQALKRAYANAGAYYGKFWLQMIVVMLWRIITDSKPTDPSTTMRCWLCVQSRVSGFFLFKLTPWLCNFLNIRDVFTLLESDFAKLVYMALGVAVELQNFLFFLTQYFIDLLLCSAFASLRVAWYVY